MAGSLKGGLPRHRQVSRTFAFPLREPPNNFQRGSHLSEIIIEDLREPDHYGRIPDSLIFDKDAPHTAIRLYAILDRHMNKKTKACYPGFRCIQSESGMGSTTISNALKYLAKAGYLRVLKTPPQAGCYSKNIYQLMDLKKTPAPETGAGPSPETGAAHSRNRSGNPLLKQEHNQSPFNQSSFNQRERGNRLVTIGDAVDDIQAARRRFLQPDKFKRSQG
jgi:hypothetical protein